MVSDGAPLAAAFPVWGQSRKLFWHAFTHTFLKARPFYKQGIFIASL
jgi:hypothetical protein